MMGMLPGVMLKNAHLLPAAPGIYFVMQEGRVLYVGRSKNLRSRWVGHHRLPQLAERQNVTLSWLQVADAADLPDVEQFFIQQLRTELNDTPVPREEDGGRVNTFVDREFFALLNELQGMNAARDAAIEATHPGFMCRCDKCGSYRVYVDSDAGRSEESGAWGGVFMKCADCEARADLWDNF